jgi:hypothetical protein
MEQALDALDSHCDFHLDRTVSGVISGEQEALYDWLATNTIFGTLGGEHVAAVDLGGASTQIAVPIVKGAHGLRLEESESCPSTAVPLSNGQTVEVYATSLLGFGLLSAMNHVLDHLEVKCAVIVMTLSLCSPCDVCIDATSGNPASVPPCRLASCWDAGRLRSRAAWSWVI